MTDLVIADHQATFALHPLEGSSRFSLLGLLAGLNGLTRPAFSAPFDDSAMDERSRLLEEFEAEAFGVPLERTSEGTK